MIEEKEKAFNEQINKVFNQMKQNQEQNEVNAEARLQRLLKAITISKDEQADIISPEKAPRAVESATLSCHGVKS